MINDLLYTLTKNWAEVHISHRVIVFVFYGKKIKCIRILGHECIHMECIRPDHVGKF